MLGKVLMQLGQRTEPSEVLAGGGSAFAAARDPKIENIQGKTKGNVIVREKQRNNTNVEYWKIAQHLPAHHTPEPPHTRDPA